jgi:hypothetical protein
MDAFHLTLTESSTEFIKLCSKCGLEKPLAQFNKDRTKRLGVSSQCKPCASQTASEYYTKNSEKIRSRITSYSHSYVPKYYRDRLSRLKNLLTKARLRTKKDFDPSLTPKDLDELWIDQEGQCALSGLPLSIEANQSTTVSLDRIDSTKGYMRGNLQLVTAVVNRMKQEFSQEDFLQMCETITNYTQKTTRN